MFGLPLSILALAAGVYLLMKVKKEFQSTLFSALAWLVIVASIGAIVCSSVRCVHMCCHGMRGGENCRMEKRIIIREEGEGGSCNHEMGSCEMKGCNIAACHMEGDSCVMDKEACEKMMGKEACEKMCKERGRCIMGKDECMKMCHKNGTPCCMDKEGGMKGKGECCMKKGKEAEEKKEKAEKKK